MSSIARSISSPSASANRLCAVVGFGDHFEIGLGVEDQPQAASHEAVIVGEQDPRGQARHAASSAAARDAVRARALSRSADRQARADQSRPLAHPAHPGAVGGMVVRQAATVVAHG